MKRIRNWVVAVLAVSAAAGVFALQNRPAPLPVIDVTSSLEIGPVEFDVTETPTNTPAYEGCAFIWAYHDAPELTEKINDAVLAINPDARANVRLFGEDCVYADGHSTFSTMTSDFYIHVPVTDLSAEADFGNFMWQVLEIVNAVPDDEIPGSVGLVEFSFIKNEAEQIILRVERRDYLNDAVGISGAELFRRFYTPIPPLRTPVPATSTPTLTP